LSAIATVAPSGPIATKSDNPTLPTQPDEIAAAVAGAYQLGASIAHIHLRDEQDRPTADLNQLSFLVSAGIVAVTIAVVALPGRRPRGRVNQNAS
jgi:uncharacterized protein (DUF849 family)